MLSERLELEHTTLRDTLARSDRAWLLRASADLHFYEVEFDVRTLVKGAGGCVVEEERVVGVHYQLDGRHPARPPLAVVREADLFNAHVADPHGPTALPIPQLCLGPFHPQLRLADWVVATYDVLRWQRIATDNVLNPEAAAFARRELRDPRRFPLDERGFWREVAR